MRDAPVSLERVGAHYGVSSLFTEYADADRVYCYRVEREDARVLHERPRAAGAGAGPRHLRDHGGVRCAWPSASSTWATTTSPGERCRIRATDAYERIAEELAEPFRRADLPEILRVVDRAFATGVYSLRLVFRDERQRILGYILRSVLRQADDVYRELYEENVPLMRFLSSQGIAQPRGFRLAAELALNTSAAARARGAGARARRASPRSSRRRAASGIALHEDGLGLAVQHTRRAALRGARARARPISSASSRLERIVDLARSLPFEVDFWKVQNGYYQLLVQLLPARRREADGGIRRRGAMGRALPGARREALGQGRRARARGAGVARRHHSS